MEIKDLTKKAILIGIYFILININPIGFGMIQFRIGEAMSVIPFFNRKYVGTFILAAGLANIFSPLGIIDIGVGISCAAITYAISKYIDNKHINAAIFSLVSGLIVGLALYYTSGLNFWLSFISISLSQLIITNVGVYIFSLKQLEEIIMD